MATNESVRVMVRFRPTNKSEQKKARSMEPWKTLQETDKGIRMNENQLTLHNIEEHGQNNIKFKERKEKFYFDALMDKDTTQIEAFEKVAQQICDEIIQGYNGTIFVYGQSGSGKTHTMYGPEDEKDSDNIEKMGVIPQSCAYIFQILNNKDHPLVEGMLSYEVQCEFIEIYNENLKDLLDLNNKPEIKQICVNAHKDEWKVIVRNVQRRRVKDMMEVLTAIRYASKNRTVAGTNLNATSSRSHMVMRLIVKIETADGIRTGIGNFSDLAGSEKVKKTGAKGKRLQEAKSILLSLTTLSRVIEALVKNKLPPFQESKLTFMLKDSLGGNCKTALLIAASPHVFNRDETIRSLQFGERCRKIQNKAKINAVQTKAQLIKENEALKKEIEKLKNSSQEFVMVEDKKSIEKEKQKFEARIKQLEESNGKLSEQIKEASKQKEENDEFYAKIGNDYEDLIFQHTQLKASMEEQKRTIQELEKEMGENKSNKEELERQLNESSESEKKLNQEIDQQKVENKRLQETNQGQINEINQLKKQYEQFKTQQADLQNKWETELNSKKSQFSNQEMQMQKQIESLQLQIDQGNQSQEQQKKELSQNLEKMKRIETNMHELQDANTIINNQLNDEKSKNNSLSSENEELKTRIEELLSQLQQQKMKNEGFDLKLSKEKDRYKTEIQEQESKVNDLEFQIEMKSNELQTKTNIIEAMKKAHQDEIRNLRQQMQAVADLNKQLQEENQTATEVVDDQKEQINKHQRQATQVKEEADIIKRQYQQLQSHYSKVIQQQIEADAKLALEMQRREREEFFKKKKEIAKRKRDKKRKSVKLSGVDYGDDDDDEEDLLPGYGITPGGGGSYEQQVEELFSDKDEEPEEEEEEEEESDGDDEKKSPKIMKKDAQSKENDDSDDDSDEGSDDEMDISTQQALMFGAAIDRKRDSMQAQKNKKELLPIKNRDKIRRNDNKNDPEATKRMMEMARKQREMQEQLEKDFKMAQSLYEQQQNLHNAAWGEYGAPELSKMEKEKQKQLAEMQRKKKEKEERHRQYIQKNYINVADIKADTEKGKTNFDTQSKGRKGKDKKKKKVKQNVEEENYIDPKDGMGDIVIIDDDADY